MSKQRIENIAAEQIKSKSPRNYDELLKYTREAKDARDCIPHFNLEGLWIGASNHEKEGHIMINVTYSEDTLIATTVIGNTTVPRGSVSFTADLSNAMMNNDSN
eukprot:865274-Ditylum_brightwellii.AAC.1